jgi:hypothetical protein
MSNLDEPAAVQATPTAPAAPSTPRADQRLARKYRFDDPNMDLFFLAALGWGKSGGLDVGEVFEIASHITDGDADSWIRAFERQAHRRTCGPSRAGPGPPAKCASRHSPPIARRGNSLPPALRPRS